MSENLDLVRSIYADWERGNFGSAEWADPEIEFVRADSPVPGSWTGVAGMTEGWRVWASAWEDYRIVAEEFRELDAERVLVLSRFGARGKTGGMELGQMRTKSAGVFHVRNGKVTKLVSYLDRERALADLGLAPESGS
jgi:ketosteroid isomerase-like protein